MQRFFIAMIVCLLVHPQRVDALESPEATAQAVRGTSCVMLGVAAGVARYWYLGVQEERKQHSRKVESDTDSTSREEKERDKFQLKFLKSLMCGASVAVGSYGVISFLFPIEKGSRQAPTNVVYNYVAPQPQRRQHVSTSQGPGINGFLSLIGLGYLASLVDWYDLFYGNRTIVVPGVPLQTHVYGAPPPQGTNIHVHVGGGAGGPPPLYGGQDRLLGHDPHWNR